MQFRLNQINDLSTFELNEQNCALKIARRKLKSLNTMANLGRNKGFHESAKLEGDRLDHKKY